MILAKQKNGEIEVEINRTEISSNCLNLVLILPLSLRENNMNFRSDHRPSFNYWLDLLYN